MSGVYLGAPADATPLGHCFAPQRIISGKLDFPLATRLQPPLHMAIRPEDAARDSGKRRKASWRSGYAEDCKSLHPGSIPGEASIIFLTH